MRREAAQRSAKASIAFASQESREVFDAPRTSLAMLIS